MGNKGLIHAKEVKNDEFYTRFEDIESEINAYYEYDHDVFRGKTVLCPCDDPEWSNFTKFFAVNFKRFGLKKLISTSYAKGAGNRQTTILEFDSPHYNKEKHETHGKLFTLTHDTDGSGIIDSDDIEFNGYLEGDGDFRSPEVCKLRDEADIIVTNPPFSLFREFIAWIRASNKKFIIMGNKNAITSKEIFPLLMNNNVWAGFTSLNGGRWMILPKNATSKYAKKEKDGRYILNIHGVCWFTNVEHGNHHMFFQTDSFENNLRYNHKLRKKLKEYSCESYPHYDEFNAIEVPFTECIPSDYDGVMGVPISFLDKYNPDQFEIIGLDRYVEGNPHIGRRFHINGKETYARILIRHRRPAV